ncbi:MAG: hypothetical protein Q9173_003352 [Seirophora scorigena]
MDKTFLPPGGLWRGVFEELLGKKFTREQSFLIKLRHDQPFFINVGGRVRPQFRASYTQYHIPALSAIISDQSRGPVSWVKTRYLRDRRLLPSDKHINDLLVPPLNRWSDVTWTLWAEKAGNSVGNLRYIARSSTINEDT